MRQRDILQGANFAGLVGEPALITAVLTLAISDAVTPPGRRGRDSAWQWLASDGYAAAATALGQPPEALPVAIEELCDGPN